MTETKWTWKTWTVGVAVALSAAATWLLAHVGGEGAPESKSAMPCSSSHVVFAQKKRCGFVDLGELAVVEGCLKSTKTHSDGD